MAGKIALEAIESRLGDFEKLAHELWKKPETAYNEVYANKVTCELARELGFNVESPAFGMPTCLVASWGSGPAIGYLGELDALPGLSQKCDTKEDPVELGAPGQGCGHNLLCVSGLAAAYGVKEELRQTGKPGRVVYYGCPAEEQLTGKPFMARGGAFKDLDIAFAWHGGRSNDARTGKSTGLNSATFHFHGRTAHAGGDPHNGRSALDAVELMNVGANYLREHVTSDVRIHYTITEGGTAPNIVPDRASVWYFVRAMSRAAIEETYDRLCEVARGAAQMTGTTVDIEFMGGCYDTMPNLVLAKLLHESMEEVGAPVWTKEELDFADQMNKNTVQYDPAKFPAPLSTRIEPMRPVYGYGSTDVADVQHIVPCAMLNTTTTSSASPGHSWQIASCAGHSIGFKGMIFGAKSMAVASMRALESPEIIKEAKKEFDAAMEGHPYKCPIPADVPVPQPKTNK